MLVSAKTHAKFCHQFLVVSQKAVISNTLFVSLQTALFKCQIGHTYLAYQMGQQYYYIIQALPSTQFSIHNQKNHQKIYYKREGKQTFFVNKQDQLFINHQFCKQKTIDSNTCVTQCTVKPVYNDHPWDPKIVAVIDRWSLFRGRLCSKSSKWDLQMVVVIYKWSLFGGGRQLRFDCILLNRPSYALKPIHFVLELDELKETNGIAHPIYILYLQYVLNALKSLVASIRQR